MIKDLLRHLVFFACVLFCVDEFKVREDNRLLMRLLTWLYGAPENWV